jgi:hypothetical protein
MGARTHPLTLPVCCLAVVAACVPGRPPGNSGDTGAVDVAGDRGAAGSPDSRPPDARQPDPMDAAVAPARLDAAPRETDGPFLNVARSDDGEPSGDATPRHPDGASSDATSPPDAARPPDARRPPDAIAGPADALAGPVDAIGREEDGGLPPAERRCDGLDEDGDGDIDEGLGCYVDVTRSIWSNFRDNLDFYYAREPGLPPYWNCSEVHQCNVMDAGFRVYAATDVPGTVPLEIVYDPLRVAHVLTIDAAEVAMRVAQGALHLGHLGYVLPAADRSRRDATTLKRLYNERVTCWLFTTDPAEFDNPAAFASTHPTLDCCRVFSRDAPP